MAEDTEQDKSVKERSPSFPFISLGKALDRARQVADAHKRIATRVVTVADTWGYGQQSSGLQQTISALKGYGLLEIIGKGPDRKIQLTDLVWRILHDQRPGAKEQAIKEAALRPRLFAEYAQHWLPERPGDNHCISELHLDRGFTQVAAELFLRVFDETATFANLRQGDSLSPSLPEESGTVGTQTATDGDSLIGAMIRRAAPPLPATEPFKMEFGPGRITGSFDLTKQSEAEEMIKMINVMKAFLRPGEPEMKEAAN